MKKSNKLIKNIIIYSLLSVGIISCVTTSIILKSGKDGLNGKDGSVNSIGVVDGNITIDQNKTPFSNENLSAFIYVNSNNFNYGEVSESNRYPLNSAVNIYAKPYKGYIFKYWENENKDILSESSVFTIKASSIEHTFTAIFDIDKSNVSINVNIRKDNTLPETMTVLGEGIYKFNDEYKLSVMTSEPDDLKNGVIFYFEVNKEQFNDVNFDVEKASLKAVAKGETAFFNVEDVYDKYYIVHYKTNSISVVDNPLIDIVVSSSFKIESSSDIYGLVKTKKVNDKDYKENETIIFPGDKVVVEATPYTCDSYDSSFYGWDKKIERSTFLYWFDLLNDEIVSYDSVYSFVAKQTVHLKAFFKPKTVIHLDTKGILINIISSSKTFSPNGYENSDNIKGAAISYYAGEELIIYLSFSTNIRDGITIRNQKFYIKYSYDGVNYSYLSYDKQAYLIVPESTPDIYLSAGIE